MSEIKVSIIVPVYNTEKYLEKCLDSLLNQTLKEIEVICVDDGSTDSSGDICDKYQVMDNRVRVIHQNNGGTVLARKAALGAASGKYIGFVDSDDYVEPDMYEKLYQKIEDSEADIVNSGIIEDGIKRCNYEEGLINFDMLSSGEFINEYVFGKKIPFCLWSKLFKAEIIKEAFSFLPDEQSYGEDLLCLCNYVLKCKKVYMYRDAFYHYRIYQGSLSHKDWLYMCLEESKLHSCVIKILNANGLLDSCGPSAKRHYKERVMQSIIYDNIHIERYRFPDIEILKEKKIVIYGAGKVGKDYYSQISKYRCCDIVAWVDKDNSATSELIPIEKPDVLKNISYDIIILAVKSKTIAKEIENELIQNGSCRNRELFVWEEAECLW